ncbi:hypothetical protein A4A49_30887, partial [Nicotiana attenuata]
MDATGDRSSMEKDNAEGNNLHVEYGVNTTVAADRVEKEASVSKNWRIVPSSAAILNGSNATYGTAGLKNSIVMPQEIRTDANGGVTVPVAAALNIVVKDLKAATGPVFDRGSAGVCKGPDAGQKFAEAGHQIAKGQATDRGVFSTSQAAGTLKATGKSVQNAKAGGSSKNTGDKKAVNAVQETKGGEWSVMNRSNPSPNKSKVPVQVVALKTVSVASSFGILMNEYEEDSGKNWQQASLEAEQKSRQLPGDGKQQNLPKHTAVSANVSKDIVLVDGKSVSQAGQNSSPSSGKHPVSSSSKRDQGRGNLTKDLIVREELT